MQRTFKRIIIRWRTRYYINFYIHLADVIKVQSIFRGKKTRTKLTENHFAIVLGKAQHLYAMTSELIPEITTVGKQFHDLNRQVRI